MTLLALVGAFALAILYKVYLRFRRISISDIPGPEAESFIIGM